MDQRVGLALSAHKGVGWIAGNSLSYAVCPTETVYQRGWE